MWWYLDIIPTVLDQQCIVFEASIHTFQTLLSLPHHDRNLFISLVNNLTRASEVELCSCLPRSKTLVWELLGSTVPLWKHGKIVFLMPTELFIVKSVVWMPIRSKVHFNIVKSSCFAIEEVKKLMLWMWGLSQNYTTMPNFNISPLMISSFLASNSSTSQVELT